jgi:aryl-phospho-beta-D-glucosidase BglC (GH1 family)
LAVLALLSAIAPAGADVPANRRAILAHGINITRWFSAPYVQPPSHYSGYVTPTLLGQLKSAGFSYIRLVLAPEALQTADGSLNQTVAKSLIEQMAQIEQAGLGVAILPIRHKWHLDSNSADQGLFLRFWQQLAPMLTSLNQDLTFPEILSEPNFPNSGDWDELQLKAYRIIRAQLPNATLIATGNHFSDVDNLPKVRLVPDQNIVYTFHYYEPHFLTSTDSKDVRQEDMRSLSSLIFPVNDQGRCAAVGQMAQTTDTQNQVKWYCKSGWTVAKVRSQIHAIGEWTRSKGVYAVAGEFGILNDRPLETRLAYLRAVREACESDGLGWALWGYDDGFGFAIFPDKGGGALDPGILNALGLRAPTS